MATVDKNFKVKHGLVVEGTTATVNGNDILTTANTTSDLTEGTNQYFTDQRAKDAAASLITNATKTNITITGDGNGLTIAAENGVADSTTDDLAEGISNLYFTNQRALDATVAAYDGAGSAANAQTNAETFATNAINALTTDDIEEGVANLYFTDSRAKDAVGNAVGTGLFFNTITKGISVAENTYDAFGAATTAENNAKAYADSLATNYDAAGAAAAAETAANLYTDNAVATVVGGAPALLDTLNELAAAIADNPNYATDVANLVAGKQDTLTAGSGISINPSTDEISVDDTVIASVSYVDANFVNIADLPGQLDDYVPLTQKGANDGVATLDSTGQVPLSQLGNVPDAYITSVGNNLSVTGGELTIAATPTFTAVDFDTVAKQVAAKINTIGSTPTTLYSFKIGPLSDAYTSAEYTISSYATKNGVPTSISEREITKILLTTDNGGNVAITEYGTVTMNDHVLDITAEVITVGTPGMGGYYQCNLIASSAISGVTVDHATVVGTLFK